MWVHFIIELVKFFGSYIYIYISVVLDSLSFFFFLTFFVAIVDQPFKEVYNVVRGQLAG